MNLFWRWERVIPPAVCEEAKKCFQGNEKGKVGGSLVKGHYSAETRECEVSFLPSNHWVEGILYTHAVYANECAKWNYDISKCSPVQLTKYTKGNYYDWHCDDGLISPSESPEMRKLSAVLLLSDPAEYTDGGLLIDGYEGNVIGNQGDLIVFPSFVRHKAVEVTGGTRMTAVGWIMGPRFK